MSSATRRGFLTGALGLLAAPAIVRVASLMPVSAPRLVRIPTPFLELTGAEDLEAVIYSARKRELVYQIMKRQKEQRRDMEMLLG